MNKKIYAAVMERADGRCEWCGVSTYLVPHHCIHGHGKRQSCETVYSVIAICETCHTTVHGNNGHEMDIEMKLELQRLYFRQGRDENEVRTLMGGRLYFKGDEK